MQRQSKIWIAVVVVCGLGAQPVVAQTAPACASPAGPGCTTAAGAAAPNGNDSSGRCLNGCQPGCKCAKCCTSCKPPCDQPCCPPPQVALPYQPVETGMYVAPPAVGTTVGAAGRVGIEGGGLTFPELRLRLPRWELPSFFRGRSNAHMVVDSAVAPWQSTGYANAAAGQNELILQQQVLLLQQQLAQTSPASGPTQAEAQASAAAAHAAQAELERMRCELNRLRQLESAIQQHQEAMRANPGCQTSQGYGVPTPAHANPGPVPTPSPDADARFRLYPTQPIQQQPPTFAPAVQPVSTPVVQPLPAVQEVQGASYLAPAPREPAVIYQPQPLRQPAPAARFEPIRQPLPILGR